MYYLPTSATEIPRGGGGGESKAISEGMGVAFGGLFSGYPSNIGELLLFGSGLPFIIS